MIEQRPSFSILLASRKRLPPHAQQGRSRSARGGMAGGVSGFGRSCVPMTAAHWLLAGALLRLSVGGRYLGFGTNKVSLIDHMEHWKRLDRRSVN